MTKLLSALKQRLHANAHDYAITMACPLTDCIENDIDLMISQHGVHLAAWNVPARLEFRCSGDIEAAADEVVADLRQRREPTS
jgi:hypothetical protein